MRRVLLLLPALVLLDCARYNADGSYLALFLLQQSLASSSTGPKRIFLTAGTDNGIPGGGGISGADSRCNSDANRPSTTATYKALLADNAVRISCTTAYCAGGAAENVDWSLKPNTTYYRADGTTPILTTNAAGIATFPLTNSFTGTADEYWTGLRGAGTEWVASSMRRCNQWTNNTLGATGATGIGNVTDATSIRFATPTCDSMRKFLCVEQ